MPKQRMALRMIKDVIRLKWDAGLSHEQIAAALGVSKGVVGKYVSLAAAVGLNWEQVRDWDERSRSRDAFLLTPPMVEVVCVKR